jgi:hypothetical protein
MYTDERVCALQRDKRLLYTYLQYTRIIVSYMYVARGTVYTFIHVRRLFDFVCHARARVSADFRLVTIFLTRCFRIHFFVHCNIILLMRVPILIVPKYCQRLHRIRCTLQRQRGVLSVETTAMRFILISFSSLTHLFLKFTRNACYIELYIYTYVYIELPRQNNFEFVSKLYLHFILY